MFKNNEANFFKTEDNEQIFYLKNFNQYDETKKTLVLNYGLVCSNHHWRFQSDFFDQQGYQVIMHDYRGHFQSSGKQDVKKITFPQIAKDIFDLCGFLGVKKAALLGHSMGVNINLQMAKDYPDFVEKMVLISGTIMPVNDVMFDSNVMEFITPFLEASLDKYPDVVRKIWSSTGMNPLVKSIIHSTGFNKAKVSAEFIEIYLNRVGQLGPEIFFQLFNEMTKQNITSSLDRMTMPSLVIGGYKDNVIPNHLQRTLASILPNSETYFFVNGSHVPQVDYPELINERMNLFLSK